MHETTQEVRAPPSARPRVALCAVRGGRGVRVARGAALAAMAIGASVLVGWWIGEPRLTGTVAGWPATTANSALLCLLAGASLWALAPAEAMRRARLLGAICALAVLLLAALTVVEHAVDRDLGLDHLLVGGAEVGRAIGHGRPSLQTLACFALLAAALLLLGSRTAQALAALAGAVSIFALIGYLFGVPAMYGVEEYRPLIGMGALTSLAVLALSAGALAARPSLGPVAVLTGGGQGGVAARELLIGVAVIAPFAVVVQLAALAGWLPAPFGAALIVFVGLLLGTALVLRTATRLDRTGAELGAALAEATRWKRMFDSSAIAAAVASPSGAILAANPAFALLHGGEAREILGRPLAELLPRDEHQALEARLAALGPGEHDTIEMSHAAPDGRERVVLVDATAIAGAEGRTAYLAIYVRDMTEDRRAERDRASLASLVDSSDDAIVAKTLEGRVLSWNAAAERMYGYSAREMIGESILRLVPPERASELTRFLAAIGRGERVRSHETARIRRDGSRFPRLAHPLAHPRRRGPRRRGVLDRAGHQRAARARARAPTERGAVPGALRAGARWNLHRRSRRSLHGRQPRGRRDARVRAPRARRQVHHGSLEARGRRAPARLA
ncbi:MAG: PAS domain S-box protein [Sandaracinaceae bacterium]|nr:PAS domain S-box protein [Sandaracinaceae bacterium]